MESEERPTKMRKLEYEGKPEESEQAKAGAKPF
jgi:hypothetical protein